MTTDHVEYGEGLVLPVGADGLGAVGCPNHSGEGEGGPKERVHLGYICSLLLFLYAQSQYLVVKIATSLKRSWRKMTHHSV